MFVLLLSDIGQRESSFSGREVKTDVCLLLFTFNDDNGDDDDNNNIIIIIHSIP